MKDRKVPANMDEFFHLLMEKAADCAVGENLAGSETLCRMGETVIKYARLNLDRERFMATVGQLPQAPMKALPEPSNHKWTPFPVENLDTADRSVIDAAIHSGEKYLDSLEEKVEIVENACGAAHPAVKVYAAEASWIRCYLMALRDFCQPEVVKQVLSDAHTKARLKLG